MYIFLRGNTGVNSLLIVFIHINSFSIVLSHIYCFFIQNSDLKKRCYDASLPIRYCFLTSSFFNVFFQNFHFHSYQSISNKVFYVNKKCETKLSLTFATKFNFFVNFHFFNNDDLYETQKNLTAWKCGMFCVACSVWHIH
jgi:hypothetical protein